MAQRGVGFDGRNFTGPLLLFLNLCLPFAK